VIRDGILVNPGQVAFGTGEEGPIDIERVDVWADRGNVGIQQRTDRMTYGNVRVRWPGTAWAGGTTLGGYPEQGARPRGGHRAAARRAHLDGDAARRRSERVARNLHSTDAWLLKSLVVVLVVCLQPALRPKYAAVGEGLALLAVAAGFLGAGSG
jgi:hypothetical protein